ncbi:MAG: hypothetical protein R3B06_02425 [Kofleriaceae bacterium]
MIARPRFRTDLVAEPIDDGGKRFIDVVDPDSGNGFRFFEVEYSLACAMDGARDIADIQRWAKEELGLEASATEVATVISTLGDLGYLDGVGREVDGPELAAGVVAARPAAPTAPTIDIELGDSGGQAPRAREPLPVAADLELGGAGGTAAAAPPPMITDGPELGPSGGGLDFDTPTPPPAAMPSATMQRTSRPDAEEDGPTNLPKPRMMDYDDDEVSVDLSDHLAVSASDVKEAVRASKVMAAVDVPTDVLAQLEEDEARARAQAAEAIAERAAADQRAAEAAAREAAAQAAADRAAAEAQAAAAEAAARAVEQRSAVAEVAAATAAVAGARDDARAVAELPQIPVGVSKKKPERPAKEAEPAVAAAAPAPTTTKKGTSPFLIFLLVLAILLGGAFLLWTKVLKKPLPWEPTSETAATPAPPPVAPTPPTPPTPPPPPSAVLTEKPGDVSPVVAGQVGIIESVVETGAKVGVGDTVLTFVASPADAKAMAGFDNDLDKRYPKQLKDAEAALARAQAGGNPGAIKSAETKVAEVQKKIDARSAERDALRAKLDGLTIKAPIAGVVALEPKIAKGTKTTPDQTVATVTGAALLTATFTVPSGGKAYSQDASVMLTAKSGEKANCTASSVDGPTVVVTCPPEAGLAAGTEIVLE